MKRWIVDEEFAAKVVEYFNNNSEATVRSTAKRFGIGKSTAHKILTKVLPNETSRAKLEKNKKEAPYRAVEVRLRK